MSNKLYLTEVDCRPSKNFGFDDHADFVAWAIDFNDSRDFVDVFGPYIKTKYPSVQRVQWQEHHWIFEFETAKDKLAFTLKYM